MNITEILINLTRINMFEVAVNVFGIFVIGTILLYIVTE